MKYYGVITGDIISSSKFDKREILIDLLKDSFKEINSSLHNKEARFEIIRGDSFQLLIPYAEDSLRIAILIKSKLRRLSVYRYDKTYKMISSKSWNKDKKRPINIPTSLLWDGRISIGIGTVDSIKPKLSESTGQAFDLSGREFDKMKKRGQSLVIKTPWELINDEFKIEAQLASAIISRWTQSGSEANYYYFLKKDRTQEETANLIKISQSSINRRLIAANYDVISSFIERFETLIIKNTK